MENYTGELIALGVAVSWTITALCFEYAGKKIGALALNVVRLTLAILMLGIMLQYFTGSIAPWNAGWEAWGWLTLSGLVGYVFGDFCLFNSYLIIGARFGQLFMTLAPLFAAITGYLFLGENMNLSALLGMLICITGIGLSIIGQTDSAKEKNGNSHKWEITLPTKGILLGIGAALGQGVGLVLSKMGINSYLTHVPPVTPTETFMVPFATGHLHCRHLLRSIRGSRLLAHGRAIHGCRHSLHPHGPHPRADHPSLPLHFQGANHFPANTRNPHQHHRRQFIFPVIITLTLLSLTCKHYHVIPPYPYMLARSCNTCQ